MNLSANDTAKKLDKGLLGSKERKEVKLSKKKIIFKVLEAQKGVVISKTESSSLQRKSEWYNQICSFHGPNPKPKLTVKVYCDKRKSNYLVVSILLCQIWLLLTW